MTSSYLPPVRGDQWFRDQDGVLARSKRFEEKLTETIDYSRNLGSVTISSVAYDASGVTLSGTSNTTTTVTFSVTGSGKLTIQLTLSDGRTLYDERAFYATDYHNDDYAE